MGFRHKKRSRKLEDINRYVGVCRYCKKNVYSQDSFVAMLKSLEPTTYYHAHYSCMKLEEKKQQQDPRHNQT